jgi:c-di-GMP-binding flagellar brake protein YcgR
MSGIERRIYPRYSAELRCALSLPEDDSDLFFAREEMRCRTRDLSEAGVGLLAPSIYLGYTCVVDEGRTLRLSLDLPRATVRMEATPAHYVRLGGATPEEASSYVVGLRITSMSDADRALYLTHLEELDAQERA